MGTEGKPRIPTTSLLPLFTLQIFQAFLKEKEQRLHGGLLSSPDSVFPLSTVRRDACLQAGSVILSKSWCYRAAQAQNPVDVTKLPCLEGIILAWLCHPLTFLSCPLTQPAGPQLCAGWCCRPRSVPQQRARLQLKGYLGGSCSLVFWSVCPPLRSATRLTTHSKPHSRRREVSPSHRRPDSRAGQRASPPARGPLPALASAPGPGHWEPRPPY